MKKRIILAITLIAALSIMVGCGKNKDVVEENGTAVVEDIDPNEYVTLGDYSAITISIAPKVEVTEKQVEEKYQAVLLANKSYESVTDRPAETGDLVEIDYIGTVAGEEFDSGTIGADGQDFLLGSQTMIDGFEEAILGMRVGEQKIADITFPEQYTETLAGKEAQFDITLKVIKKEIYPEILTEAMITAVNSDCKTEEELKAAFRAELEKANEDTYLENTKREALNVVLNASTFEEKLPAVMIEEAKSMILAQTEQWAGAYGVDLETLVTSYFQQTMEEFYVDLEQQALTYVKSDLLMQVLIEKEKVKATKKDVKAYGEEHYKNYGYESAAEFIEAIGEESFYPVIESERVFDILLENTTVNDLVVGK